jgi:hypothetical protein
MMSAIWRPLPSKVVPWRYSWLLLLTITLRRHGAHEKQWKPNTLKIAKLRYRRNPSTMVCACKLLVNIVTSDYQ